MSTPTVALLIDAENISVRYLPIVLAIAHDMGRPIIRRIFGDFTQGRLDRWQRDGLVDGFSIDHEPSSTAGKNTSDIRLTITAMDMAATRIVDGFCIVSGDRDFAPLLRRLREGGYCVHAVGTSTTDASLRGAATQFHSLDMLGSMPASIIAPNPVATAPHTPKPTAAKPPSTPKSRIADVDHAEREVVVKILETLCKPAGKVSLSTVGSLLRQQYPSIAKKIGGPGFGKRLIALNAVAAVRPDGLVVLPGRSA